VLLSVADAERRQRELAARVVVPTGPVPAPRTVAGLDVSYAVGSDRVAVVAVVVDAASGTVLEEAVVDGVAAFPYVPGLLAFREVPLLTEVLDGLRTPVDLLLCDGHGIAHPRRYGLAAHLGVVRGLPAVGCAKNRFVGEHAEPGPRRGDRAPLRDGDRVLGEVLRTQDGVRPVHVAPGHLIGVAQASEVVLGLCTRYRLPDPVRRADQLSRAALR
jgi:deoxyribonuclease V